MHFTAVLKQQSAVAREWRSRNLNTGLFMGLQFKRQGPDYVAENIEPSKADELQRCVDLMLEMTTAKTISDAELLDFLFSDPE